MTSLPSSRSRTWTRPRRAWTRWRSWLRVLRRSLFLSWRSWCQTELNKCIRSLWSKISQSKTFIQSSNSSTSSTNWSPSNSQLKLEAGKEVNHPSANQMTTKMTCSLHQDTVPSTIHLCRTFRRKKKTTIARAVRWTQWISRRKMNYELTCRFLKIYNNSTLIILYSY